MTDSDLSPAQDFGSDDLSATIRARLNELEGVDGR